MYSIQARLDLKKQGGPSAHSNLAARRPRKHRKNRWLPRQGVPDLDRHVVQDFRLGSRLFRSPMQAAARTSIWRSLGARIQNRAKRRLYDNLFYFVLLGSHASCSVPMDTIRQDGQARQHQCISPGTQCSTKESPAFSDVFHSAYTGSGMVTYAINQIVGEFANPELRCTEACQSDGCKAACGRYCGKCWFILSKF